MSRKPNEPLHPIRFMEANKNLLKPDSMTDDECSSLFVYTDGHQCVSCWKMPLLARIQALLTGRVWLCVLGGSTQPPVWLACGKTVFNQNKGEAGKEDAHDEKHERAKA